MEPSLRSHPVRSIGGRIVVPGDKSISHRALMLGAIAEGPTTVRGFLGSEDCLATLAAVEALGVTVERLPGEALRIAGVGPNGLEPPERPLDLGNSGTAMRLIAGLLAGQPFESRLTGDASLRQRPMERVAAPLRSMGAHIETTGGRPPLRIRGGTRLEGIDYTIPMASSQVKSAVLIAALFATGRTTVRSPAPSRDHTERMLSSMGVDIAHPARDAVSLVGPAGLRGIEIDVPGDFSSAAFFLVAGCIAASEGLLIRNVGINPTRTGLLGVLTSMGARIEVRGRRLLGAEPVADLYVERSDLEGVDVPEALVPLTIDEFPVLFVAAANASGTTRVRGAEELRAKETDRLAVMARGLTNLGIEVTEQPGGLAIRGGRAQSGRVDSHGDHRIAMAFAVAGLKAAGPVDILRTAEISTSFPGFAGLARAAGFHIEPADER